MALCVFDPLGQVGRTQLTQPSLALGAADYRRGPRAGASRELNGQMPDPTSSASDQNPSAEQRPPKRNVRNAVRPAIGSVAAWTKLT